MQSHGWLLLYLSVFFGFGGLASRIGKVEDGSDADDEDDSTSVSSVAIGVGEEDR